MGKKNQLLSPNGYLKSGKARKLPIHECLVADGWEDFKKFPVIVARQHKTGNITASFFLVDLLCTGIKDTHYFFNIPFREYEEFIKEYEHRGVTFNQLDYELAHNIIYGGLEYALDYKIDPHPDFKLTSQVLEKDDEKIPLIEIPLGEDDIPLLILQEGDPRNAYYQRQLKSSCGEGAYRIVDEEGFDLNATEEEEFFSADFLTWDEEEWVDFLVDTEDNPTKLFLSPEVCMHIFYQCEYLPNIGERKAKFGIERESFEVTDDAIREDNYSPEEFDKQSEVHSIITSETDKKKLKSVKKQLFEYIERWPEDEIFYNFLYNTHLMLGEIKKAKKILSEGIKKFPNYLFMRIAKSNECIDAGKVDEVPALLQGKYTLADLYPNRDLFHISEVKGFNDLMLKYFMKREDWVMCGLYYKLSHDLEDLHGLEAISPNFKIDFRIHTIRLVSDLITEALKDIRKLKELASKISMSNSPFLNQE